MRQLHISRRHCTPKLYPLAISIVILLARWQPAASLPTSGDERLAVSGGATEPLLSSTQGSRQTALAEYAVPSPLLLRGCPKGLYKATLRIGTQDLEVLADTGSSQLMLFGEQCMGCSPGMERYRPTASATNLGMRDGVQYGGFSAGAYGDVYLDSISVTGATVANVPGSVRLSLISAYLSGFDRDALGVQSCSNANEISDLPSILGLGNGPGGSLSKTGLTALGEDYYVQALIKAGMPGVFSMQLCDHGGLLWLGGFDRRHSRTMQLPTFVPTKQYSTPLGPSGGYRIEVSRMSIGDAERALDWTSAAYLLALVDTSNRFLSMPDSAFRDLNRTLHALYKHLRATGKYNVSSQPDAPGCVTGLPADPETLDHELPDLTVHLFRSPTETYPLRTTASRSYMVFYPARATQSSMWCMEAVNTGHSVGSIGIPLMKSSIVVFDPVNSRVGFVPQAPSTCPSLPPAPMVPSPVPSPPPAPSPPGPRLVLSRAWWIAALVCVLGLLAGAAVVAVHRRVRSSDTQQRQDMLIRFRRALSWPQSPDRLQDAREPFLRSASRSLDAPPPSAFS